MKSRGLEWIVLGLLSALLILFIYKQIEINSSEKEGTFVLTEVNQPGCGGCPSASECGGKSDSDKTCAETTDDTDEEWSDWDDSGDEWEEWSDWEDSGEVDEVSANPAEVNDEIEERGDELEEENGSAAPQSFLFLIEKHYSTLIRFTILMMIWVLISIFYHTRWIHYLRYPILLGSLIYFGFILGGCPCISLLFNDTILLLSGNSTLLIYPTLLIVLIIMTFLFGKIWCGWLCHIGALQEFLYKGERLQWLKSKKSQKILHIIQSSAVVILIIAILITKTNLVCQYFPFVNIFMLQIFNPITYFLVGLVIISSLLIYRPFCRTVCPVGLILNWVSRIPFAKRVRISECKECKRCHRHCKMGSIQGGAIDMSCIACGECSQANCETIQLTRKKDQKI